MMRLSEAARALGVELQGQDAAFAGVSTDSRGVARGELFVALVGEHFDGHQFLASAAAAGAAGAMVAPERLHASPDRAAWEHLPLLPVADTRLALGRLGAYWRSRFRLPVVGLTGSSGKTTVKEMLAAVLRAACAPGAGDDAVLATRGNLNNDIGVPLMLLALRATHRYAVIEMGMNHAGEIRYLAGLAAPNVALVTNAGRAHIEFLGSEEAIAHAKGEIYEQLAPEATAVINRDDRFAALWRTVAGGRRRIEFGVDEGDVTARCELRPLDTRLCVRTPRGEIETTLPAPGLHNVRNALAAAAAAVALDVPLAAIADGLSRFGGVKGRLQRKAAPNGATLIDDTYNANPDSVRAAIDVLAAVPGRRLLVLGDMGELGVRGPELHAEIGAAARRAGLDALYALGELTRETVRAFGSGARHFDSVDALAAAVAPELAASVTVLVKGSRFMRMERVVAALASSESNGTEVHA